MAVALVILHYTSIVHGLVMCGLTVVMLSGRKTPMNKHLKDDWKIVLGINFLPCLPVRLEAGGHSFHSRSMTIGLDEAEMMRLYRTADIFRCGMRL